MRDSIRIDVLDNGAIKTETENLSPANADSAGLLVAELARLAGGETETQQQTDAGVTHT